MGTQVRKVDPHFSSSIVLKQWGYLPFTAILHGGGSNYRFFASHRRAAGSSCSLLLSCFKLSLNCRRPPKTQLQGREAPPTQMFFRLFGAVPLKFNRISKPESDEQWERLPALQLFWGLLSIVPLHFKGPTEDGQKQQSGFHGE